MTSNPRTGHEPAEPRKRMFLEALARLIAKRVLEELNADVVIDRRQPDCGDHHTDEETADGTK